jgi:hypothetical protein
MKETDHAEKRLYANRAFGGNCHYCATDGDFAAYAAAG